MDLCLKLEDNCHWCLRHHLHLHLCHMHPLVWQVRTIVRCGAERALAAGVAIWPSVTVSKTHFLQILACIEVVVLGVLVVVRSLSNGAHSVPWQQVDETELMIPFHP